MLSDLRRILPRIARLSRACALVAGMLAVGAASRPAAMLAASPLPECPCDASDVWHVSTRHLPGVCGPVTEADLRVEHRDAPGRWNPASLEDLLADPGRPLVFFIHGNRYDACSAKQQGVMVARRLEQCRPDAGLIRTVVFSWPSDSVGLPLREARENYARARSDGHYFGALLSKVAPETDVGIVGYSFGATIALVGLEDAAAVSPEWHADRAGFLGLVLVTPAVRVDSVSPCGRYHRAIGLADRLTILTNPRDEALRFFPLLDRSGVDAVGFVGMPRRWVPEGVAFSQIDASPIVGKEHSMQSFIDSSSLSCRITNGAVE